MESARETWTTDQLLGEPKPNPVVQYEHLMRPVWSAGTRISNTALRTFEKKSKARFYRWISLGGSKNDMRSQRTLGVSLL